MNGAWAEVVICFMSPVIKLALALPVIKLRTGLERTEPIIEGRARTASALPSFCNFARRPEVMSPARVGAKVAKRRSVSKLRFMVKMIVKAVGV